jgi:hypothetical protein
MRAASSLPPRLRRGIVATLTCTQEGVARETKAMSALGHKRTFAAHKGMSALPPIADMCSAFVHVRFVPKADNREATRAYEKTASGNGQKHWSGHVRPVRGAVDFATIALLCKCAKRPRRRSGPKNSDELTPPHDAPGAKNRTSYQSAPELWKGSGRRLSMSALGQKQTCAAHKPMSALCQ